MLRSTCLFFTVTAALLAQDGSSIYKQRCATCHDHPSERIPALSTIKKMSGEAIYNALTKGTMKIQAQGLSSAQIFALIVYIGPETKTAEAAPDVKPTCKSVPAFQMVAGAPQWNGWSPALTNTRFQDASSAGLTAADLPRLKLKWAFNLGAVSEARSQPVIAGGRAFIASNTGVLYALDAASGCTIWAYRSASAIRGGATVGEAHGTAAVFFSDSGGTVYALDAQDGKLLWKVKPAAHFASVATATPLFYQGVLYQPFSSYEELLAGDPKYGCCTFRGNLAALDAGTGKTLWQTYTIADPAKATTKSAAGTQLNGPSGAAIWSTPTVDKHLDALYVATGDNYSDPVTDTSDAVLAIDRKTGKLLWSSQLTKDDAYNNACSTPVPGNCPTEHGDDFDFGQPPILVDLGSGKRALVLAQKSGKAWAIDPDDKGRVLWQKRVGAGGYLGGSQWGSASDGKNIYVAISDLHLGVAADPKSPQKYRLVADPQKGGGLHALDLGTGNIVWSAPPITCAASQTECSPAQSGAVTAIPGVVFSGSNDGHLRAYSSQTGKILWDTDTAQTFQTVNGPPAHGGSLDAAGPAVVNGMLFVNSGFGQWGGKPGNALLVFSIH